MHWVWVYVYAACMRVLHLIDSGGLYGAERMLLTLATEQQRQGMAPTILSAGLPGIPDKPVEAAARELSLEVTPWRMKPGLNLRSAWRIMTWARDNRIQLLHSHGYKFNILMGAIPRRLRHLPVITTLHGYVRAPRWTRMAVYEQLDRMILSRLDAVVIVEEGMRAALSNSHALRNRCLLIPNGLTPHTPSCAILPRSLEAFMAGNAVNLAAVGRLSPEKDFARLIDMLRDYPQWTKGVGVTIMGDGRLHGEIRRQITDAGLDARILLAGYQADAARLLSHFDGLILTSYTEGLPMIILEALRAGTPVIATSVGGIPTLLQNVPSARLVAPGDTNGLALAVAELTRGQITIDDRATGKRIFFANYTAEKMSHRYMDLYHNVIRTFASREC